MHMRTSSYILLCSAAKHADLLRHMDRCSYMNYSKIGGKQKSGRGDKKHEIDFNSI
jgi:hypothetical protein